MESDLQHNHMKPYRVRLTATADVAIEVYARSEEAARAKALNWTGGEQDGWSAAGEYEMGDTVQSSFFDDHDEMYWSIECISAEDILSVTELEEDDTVKPDSGVRLPQDSCHEQ